MKKYIIPDWIKQYENDAAPFSIEKIVLKKYEDDWTLFFYSNDDTTCLLYTSPSPRDS